MRIKYKASPNDLVAFSQFHHKHSATARRNMVICGIIIPAAFFVLTCLQGLYEGRWDLPITGAILSGALAMWIVGGRRRRLEKIVRKLLNEGSNKSLIGERELEITEAGIISRSEHGESRYAWDIIERIGFTPDYTFIFTSATQGIPISKSSAFEGDYEAFGGELRQRFEEKLKTEDVQQKQDPGKMVVTDAKKAYKEDAGFGKHSGCGIASFVIAMTTGVLDLLLFVLMVIDEVVSQGTTERSSVMLCIFATVIMAGGFANIVGVVLGITGLCQKNRKKLFAILGLVFNLAAIVMFGVLIVLGGARS
jgi:hypothetical protein